MCKIILYILCLSTCVGLLFSCKTSNHVVSGGFLSKRKYNKGWYSDFKQINSHAALSVKPSAEVPAPPDEELTTEENENEAEELVSLQPELPTTVLRNNKPHYSVALPLSSYTSKITQTNTTKKQQEEQPEPEKKKTNPWALYSFLSFLIVLFGAMALLIFSPAYFSIIFYYSQYIFFPSAILGVTSQKKKKETPSLYKNNGLAIPGIILGFSLAVYPIYLFLMLFPYDLTFLIIVYLVYLLIPFFTFLYLFYDTFLKKEKAIKPEPSDDEKEKLKGKLEKQTRFALILLFSGLLLALVLLLFPMFFLQALPKNMDFYLFLFACLVLVVGIIKYLIITKLKRSFKNN